MANASQPNAADFQCAALNRPARPAKLMCCFMAFALPRNTPANPPGSTPAHPRTSGFFRIRLGRATRMPLLACVQRSFSAYSAALGITSVQSATEGGNMRRRIIVVALALAAAAVCARAAVAEYYYPLTY